MLKLNIFGSIGNLSHRKPADTDMRSSARFCKYFTRVAVYFNRNVPPVAIQTRKFDSVTPFNFRMAFSENHISNRKMRFRWARLFISSERFALFAIDRFLKLSKTRHAPEIIHYVIRQIDLLLNFRKLPLSTCESIISTSVKG